MDQSSRLYLFARITGIGILVAVVGTLSSGVGSAQTPAIAYVQSNSGVPQTNQSSVSVPFTSAQAAGNLNVVAVGWNDSVARVQSLSDTRGNVYALAAGPTVRAGFGSQATYYAKNIQAAGATTNTVTVTFDRPAAFVDIRIAEYRGLDSVNPLDVTAVAQGSSSTSSSGSATTTSANVLLVGANLVQTTTTGPGTSFTRRLITNPDGDILEDRIVTSIGSYSATAPVSPSGQWIMQMVAFRAATGTADTQAPTAPTGLVATATSSTQINLTWTAATDNVSVTGYRVEQCQGAGCSTFTQVGTPATTSFSATGLSASTPYSYRVRATDAAGNLGPYSTVAGASTPAPPDAQAPTAPTSLLAAATSSTQINLTWTAATDNVGVTGYRVEQCQGAGCSSFSQIGTPTTTSFSATGLAASTPYSYRVRATDAAGNLGPYSTVAGASTPAPPDAQAPTAPTILLATATSSTQINLTWTAATDNVAVTGYLVEQCQGTGCSTFTQVGTPATTSFSATGLSASTPYSYRVRATDAANNLGPYSNVASASTAAPPDTEAPTAPDSLIATASSSSRINLTWTAASDNVGVTGYRVEQCQDAGCSTFSLIGTPTATSFNATGLSASTPYSYRVRATDAANNLGLYSNVASATTNASDTEAPAPPANLIATASSSSQINLTWTAATDNVGVTGYLVEQCQGTGCSTFTQVGTPTTTSFSATSLAASTPYSYRVRATDAAGNLGAYSTVANASTPQSTQPIVISLVQHRGIDAGFATSSALAFTASNTAGNWIGVAIRASQPGQTFTVSDTRGNTYRKAVQLNETLDSTSVALYYAENIAAGANTIAVSSSIGGNTLRFAILEYSGVATANSLDVTAAAQGTSALPNSGTATTTSVGNLVIGLFSTANGRTFTAGGEFVIQERVPAAPNTKLLVEDVRQATAGPVSASATLNTSDTWGGVLAAFKPVQVGPLPQPDLTIGKTHAGPFAQGQVGATYTVTVSNNGADPSAGQVTVTDSLPAGLAATAISGTGWNCTLSTLACTRTDALLAGAGYPPIIVTVNVSLSAPPSVTNSAAVSGGGDATTTNNSASDVTVIAPRIDTEPPTAPGTLSATPVSGTQVSLSWGVSTDNYGVTNYRVERCLGSACSDFVKLATPVGNAFTDTGLSTSTTYTYVVRAEDAAGNLSPYSNPVSVTTLSTVPELIAAYSFNEGSGTTVQDGSGHGNIGSIANATWTTAGKYGSALVFNGTSARVTVNDTAALRLTTAMTLEAWVNPTTISSAWRDVIYKGNDNYFLMVSSTNSARPVGGGTLGDVTGPSSITTNTWTHLAATYDGTMLRLYVNGGQVATQSLTGSLDTSTNPLEIGSDSIFGQYFQGTIDEVRVYNVALTPTQVQADMNSPIAGGTFPVLALSVNTLTFGNQATGTSSAAQAVALTNTGGVPLSLGSIALTGSHSIDFATTSTCGSLLVPNGNCSVSVTFAPTVTGTRLATLTISDNAPGAPHSVALTGVGTGFSIVPRTTVLTPSLVQQFSTSAGSSGMTWSVDGVAGGNASSGTITAAGLYSPPSLPGTHQVTVTTSDQLQSSTATVFVSNYPGTFTHHNDNARTGQNLNETVLTPSNVNSTQFGKLFSFTLDGMAMASPLYVADVSIPSLGSRNVVYVATQHDSLYAFDADGASSSPLWQRSFINPTAGVTPVPASDTGECCDISPEIGITGTPVIDPSTRTLYVVAKTKEVSGGTTNYVQRLHALDIASGAEKFGGPVVLQASVPGNGQGTQAGNVPFDALRENQRPALLLNNGVVYIAFGGHGDVPPYHGWVLGYDATTLQRVMAHNVSPDAEGGGIWQANGGPAADAAGNVYFVTGNGTFDADTGGGSYGDSFVKISPGGVVLDYFTPHDEATLNSNNFDLGAAGPLLLPDQPGTHPHLLVSAGKNNTIYLIDRDAMGQYRANDDSQIVQSLVNIFPFGAPEPGNYSAPVYFNGTVYFGPIADSVQAFRLTNGLLSTAPTSRSSQVFAYPGATLGISANGSATGILWAIQRRGDCGVQVSCGSATPGVLRAYDPANLGVELYNSDQAGVRDTLDYAAKFSVPLVANGKVFVASMSKLTVYGLFP